MDAALQITFCDVTSFPHSQHIVFSDALSFSCADISSFPQLPALLVILSNASSVAGVENALFSSASSVFNALDFDKHVALTLAVRQMHEPEVVRPLRMA